MGICKLQQAYVSHEYSLLLFIKAHIHDHHFNEKVKRTYFYYYCHSWPKYNNNLCKHSTYNSATVSLNYEAFGGKTIWKVTSQSSLHFLCSESHVGSIQIYKHHSKMNQLGFIILGSKENELLSLIGHWYEGSMKDIWHTLWGRVIFATMGISIKVP